MKITSSRTSFPLSVSAFHTSLSSFVTGATFYATIKRVRFFVLPKVLKIKNISQFFLNFFFKLTLKYSDIILNLNFKTGNKCTLFRYCSPIWGIRFCTFLNRLDPVKSHPHIGLFENLFYPSPPNASLPSS